VLQQLLFVQVFQTHAALRCEFCRLETAARPSMTRSSVCPRRDFTNSAAEWLLWSPMAFQWVRQSGYLTR